MTTVTESIVKLDLLILDEALEPTNGALAVLSDIQTEVQMHGGSSVALGGLLVLAVSQVEIALIDSLRYILRRNPWRMEFSELRVTRDEALSTELARELLESHAEQLVRDWAYGSKDHLLQRFISVAELPSSGFSEWASRLCALRNRRNELVHQKPRQRGSHGPRIWVDVQELGTCLADTKSLLTSVADSLRTRYAGYTRVAALRRLWSYLFDSPIMRFDDFWHVDEETDKVFAIKTNPLVDQLSTSERVLLGLWRAEFAGDASLLRHFSMKSLDADRRRDLVTLIAALREIWLYG